MNRFGRQDGDDRRITVLMPVKNAEKTVAAAIKSTLFALPAGGCLYVYLDACSDRTQEVVMSLKDPRLRLFSGSESRGVADSLNYLMRQVVTPLVARMDADDICIPTRFRAQLRIMNKTGADFVFLNAILFGTSVKPFGVLPQPPIAITEFDVYKVLPMSNPFVHPTLLAKTSTLRELGGYCSAPAEDYHLWLDAALASKVLVRGRSFGILYRVHVAQLTRQKTWQDELQKDEALRAKQDELKQKLIRENPHSARGESKRILTQVLSTFIEFVRVRSIK